MLPLVIAAGVVWGVAIKRIVDYSRYRGGYSSSSNNKALKSNSSLEDAERNFYLVMEATRKREEEERQRSRPIIIIKDSQVYLIKGESDELWPDRPD